MGTIEASFYNTRDEYEKILPFRTAVTRAFLFFA